MTLSILIALSLNFDTFSIAIVEGAKEPKTTVKNSIIVGLLFGISQALMTLIGSFLGLGFEKIISSIDHWIALILLVIIGGKLIIESRKNETNNIKNNEIKLKPLFFLAIATSIDALAVGILIVFMKVSIIATIFIIGIITFTISVIGYLLGKQFRKIFRNNIKIVGGLILILIGVKILIEHLYFNG